jgi:hypothetical protein
MTPPIFRLDGAAYEKTSFSKSNDLSAYWYID